MSKIPLRPFLVAKADDGRFHLTVRDTRYNSQNYPIVTSTTHSESFATATAAKAYARDNFGAEAGQFATK